MVDNLILGIETSCDETAAAVVARAPGGEGTIRSSIVLSQLEAHQAFGGIVPEIAARAHVEALDGVIRAALEDADAALDDLDAIAVTAGPGLIGGLIVGTMTAKAIAAARGLTLVPVNHLEGHALTARLTDRLAFPYLLFLMSGGHTQLVWVEAVGTYRRLGSTVDDALGEAFDKTAKLLGLGFPGGPAVEEAAKAGDSTRIPLPRPLLGTSGCNLSFSGLKTAVRQAAREAAPLGASDVADICAAFQAAVADVLADRLEHAIAMTAQTTPTAVVVAGGVAANEAIRARLSAVADAAGVPFIAPPAALCTDNAAMIAWAGAERLAAGIMHDADFTARARWPLDETVAPLYGAGAKGAKA